MQCLPVRFPRNPYKELTMISICDIHSHILPGVDDGCADVEETLRVLQSAREQGVYDLIATPHFYPDREELSAFLQRRNSAFELLKPQLPGNMRLCLGAEVAYFDGISRCDELSRLCLGNSRFLLLELPFSPWNSSLVRQLQNLAYIQGITPILAHIERYFAYQSKGAIEQVLELGLPVQMNAEHFLRFRSAYGARRLLRNGTVQLLASDCHNSTLRSYNLGKAVEHLKKHNMHEQLRRAAALSQEIFEKAYKCGL